MSTLKEAMHKKGQLRRQRIQEKARRAEDQKKNF